MPEGDSPTRGSPDMAPPSEQYPASLSSLASQRAPPAFFCSQQQTPHRVQSSTNLDLVDCVGSDLLLAMNSLDVNEQQARACANFANGCHHLLDGSGGSGGSPPPPPPPGDGFLPLAALAPPPSRQPAWLTAQQEKARVQNEHFPSSRSMFRGSSRGGNGHGNGSGGDGEEVGVRMGRMCHDDDENGGGGREAYESYPQGGSSGSSTNIHTHNNHSSGSSPGMPPPGFGPDSCSSQGSWSGSNNGSNNNTSSGNGNGGAGVRRPSSANSNSNSNNPHLDESWTAVLNAPAGAELMEFLTERASRALVLWNVEAIGEDELRAACEAHGPLYYLRTEHRRKRVIFVAYYDVRDAVNAHRDLGGELSKHLFHEQGSRPRPAVHFSIELHAGFSYKEGSLIVHNLPTQATEAEVGSVFQAYGDLRGVARHSQQHQHQHSTSFSVEFCSIQDARVAAEELTVRNPWGHGITVEPAVRSEAERALGRQLHTTLNRWTAESTQANEERMRSTSSSVVMSGRSSDSDSPTPKPEQERGRNVGYVMNLYTPMTSANTTPATTPGSTPPSGADAYEQEGGKPNGVQHYMTMPLRQYPGSAGPHPSSSSRSLHAQQKQHAPHHGRSNSGSSSAPPHPMYASSSSSGNGGAGSMPQHHYGSGGSVGHHHPHHHIHHHHLTNSNGGGHHLDNNGGGNGKPHPLATTPYGSATPAGGPNGYFVDASPGCYHPGDRDDTRTPPTPMWAAASLSLSPPSARGGGTRGSPPMRGMPGGCAGGPGGLGYKDRSRQMSLDEGRLLGGGGACGSGGARMMRSSSDSASQILMSSPHPHPHPHQGGPECSGGNNGHEFSLDLKKVSKGLDKRTTIMVRNIPNKYTQTMLLQEIDASYRGAYDFFYLPIDFKNKCNVGYAFINFIDYRRIVPFFREFNAQRWKNFNSEKVCAISYARIQGKASMISRFQNSSLMEKDGEYRPLIFHSAGAERGRPEPFPASSKAYRGVGVVPAGGGGMFSGGGVRDRERSISNSSMA
eukprot:g19745.t1